ncbi:MAG: SUMF1/EgtB/PvdO family nonheme iron enzyme [Deltaproteobacteria bacterium]|nr:SUMF1/EgtB/PvdO family nonheme iron enzyme [Deltaproteobacteria bacterium]
MPANGQALPSWLGAPALVAIACCAPSVNTTTPARATPASDDASAPPLVDVPSAAPPEPAAALAPPPIAVTTATSAAVTLRCRDGHVLVPAGLYLHPYAENGAKPQPMDAFCIGRTEVTTSAYVACVATGRCQVTPPDPRCNADSQDRGDHPINCVGLSHARAFCEADDGRLPTDEEWSYAAHGADGRENPWGNARPTGNVCCVGLDSCAPAATTCPVGTTPADRSPFGVLDTAGNVFEWTSSFLGSSLDSPIARGRGPMLLLCPPEPTFLRVGAKRNPCSAEALGFRCVSKPLP